MVIGPHPDDIELGMGATIHKFRRLGVGVHAVVLSDARQSLPKDVTASILRNECLEALSTLSVSEDNVSFFDFQVRRFSERRQDILEVLVEYNRRITPDLVFCPSLSDTHQDHAVVAQESVRAFRQTTVFSYELPWNNMGFNPTVSLQVSQLDLAKKEESLSKYVSQRHRPYFEIGLLTGLARLRASVSACEFAEVFEVIRMVAE